MDSRDLTRIALIAGAAYVAGKAIKAAKGFAWAGFGFAWVAYWTGGFRWVRHVLF
ncbi:hypothetical protein GCM10028794_10390 [Silanimonas algicola]